ncbi:hypothetical protein Y032_0165g5 [Ancylostoma ceylanicum]|uniref:Uncharacterized protein n=1 Tax=Ancylostoma ceylanicum TaxID=53326 RepID=A0A016SXA2_9BILA|nr:hypothetical protein Y032_0165g5 [Ancylostoma ceylanicum]
MIVDRIDGLRVRFYSAATAGSRRDLLDPLTWSMSSPHLRPGRCGVATPALARTDHGPAIDMHSNQCCDATTDGEPYSSSSLVPPLAIFLFLHFLDQNA